MGEERPRITRAKSSVLGGLAAKTEARQVLRTGPAGSRSQSLSQKPGGLGDGDEISRETSSSRKDDYDDEMRATWYYNNYGESRGVADPRFVCEDTAQEMTGDYEKGSIGSSKGQAEPRPSPGLGPSPGPSGNKSAKKGQDSDYLASLFSEGNWICNQQDSSSQIDGADDVETEDLVERDLSSQVDRPVEDQRARVEDKHIDVESTTQAGDKRDQLVEKGEMAKRTGKKKGRRDARKNGGDKRVTSARVDVPQGVWMSEVGPVQVQQQQQQQEKQEQVRQEQQVRQPQPQQQPQQPQQAQQGNTGVISISLPVSPPGNSNSREKAKISQIDDDQRDSVAHSTASLIGAKPGNALATDAKEGAQADKQAITRGDREQPHCHGCITADGHAHMQNNEDRVSRGEIPDPSGNDGPEELDTSNSHEKSGAELKNNGGLVGAKSESAVANTQLDGEDVKAGRVPVATTNNKSESKLKASSSSSRQSSEEPLPRREIKESGTCTPLETATSRTCDSDSDYVSCKEPCLSPTYVPGGASPESPGAKSLSFLHKTPRGGFVRHEVMTTFPVHLDDDSVRTRVLEKCQEANQKIREREAEEEMERRKSTMLHDTPPSRTSSPMLRNKSGELIKSSLKLNRTQSMPSTKAVRFDTNLEHVRRFSYREKPTAVRRAASPVTFEWGSSGSESGGDDGNEDSEDDYSSGYDEDDTEGESGDDGYSLRSSSWTAALAATAAARAGRSIAPAPKGRHLSLCNCDFSHTTLATKTAASAPVFVENLVINGKGNLVGHVCVRNLSYAKHVTAVYTQDDWKSVEEADASYSSDQAKCFDGYDRFAFEINLEAAHFATTQRNRSAERARARLNGGASVSESDKKPSSLRVQQAKFVLCVRYRSASGEYWDNNNEANYEISVRMDLDEAERFDKYQQRVGGGGFNFSGRRTIGSGHHRRNRTYPGSSLDDLHDDLMAEPQVKVKNNGLASRYNFASSYKNTSASMGYRSPPRGGDSDSDPVPVSTTNINHDTSPSKMPHVFAYNFNTRSGMNPSSITEQDFYKQKRDNNNNDNDELRQPTPQDKQSMLNEAVQDSSCSSNGGSGSNSPTSNLAHIPYHDIINKYCFFKSNSMATTPPSSTSPGLVPQGRSPSPRACSPSSAASNSGSGESPAWRPVQV